MDGATRLLRLYEAGHINARVGHHNCWEMECNRCNLWVKTSIPQRTPLASSGQFVGLESHQTGRKCTYSPKFIRARTVPPDPPMTFKTRSEEDMDVDDDDFDFTFGRSSSCPPPEEISHRPPSPLPSAPSAPNLETGHACPGVPINWNIEAGSAGWTFPWHRVMGKGATGSQTEFFRVEVDIENKRGFSKECTRSTSSGLPCSNCAKISARIVELKELATHMKPHTNYRFLNYQQLTQLVTDKDSELRKLRIKCSNLVRRLGNCVKKLTDWRRLAFAVANSDFPRLTQLLSAGLQNGAGPQKLINLLSDVVSGVVKYNPRPSTDSRTLDITLMAYVLGGRKLLYALSHGYGLPSLRTLRRYTAFTRIMPTIGTISISDILHNIEEVVFKPRTSAGKTKLRGVNLMIDETALEQRAVHFRHNNQVGGICWRHAPAVNLANELTVVAASCFGEGGTYPILALPSCKGLNADDSQKIYETVTEAWDKSGAADKVGPIWSWSTDGAMPRRIAGYRCFLSQKLSPTSPIYATLASMAGLNLYTGCNQITLDFDYKHIFKRICTLLRSTQGIVLNNGRVINPAMLARYLIRLPQHSPESVQKMLYPHDPQDVPRAIEILEAVVAVGELDYGNMDANTCGDVDALRLLGSVIKAILEPFTNVHMSLTEQITSLSTFAHLSFTLFRVSRTQYMSNQLYGDSQTMVKNAIFCLAKQQVLDPNEPFYIFQVGDDPLERLFGKLRMLGGHNTAMSYAQAIDRLGHASDLQGAFMRNPDLDQSERRLNMSRSEGVDHLSMGSFTGNLIAGSCHLPSAWADGRDKAIALFKKSAITAHEYDYLNIFSDGKTDMLAPFSDGLYPGVDFDQHIPDHSQITEEIASSASNNVTPEEDSDSDEGDGVTFEEAIDAETVPELELPSGPGITPSDYLLVNGKWVHKQRVCRLVINKDFEPNSIVRLLRVRGHANVNAKPRDDMYLDPNALFGKDTFFVGDPLLTLLRTDTKISVAVLRTTAIHQDGVSRSHILAQTIKNPEAKVKITGQVYSLTLIRKTAALDVVGPIRTSATIRSKDWLESDEEESEWAWIWNGEYLKVDSVMKGTSGSDKVTTDKVVLVSVPGVLTELVNPVMVDASIRLGEQMASRINSLGQSWEIDDRQLGLVAELLWGRAVENKIAPKSVTTVSTSPTFPYAFDDGNPALLSAIPTQQLIQEHGERINRVCELCGEKADNQRAHMGAHILRKLRGVEEELIKPVGDSLPCGFCGESGHAACNVYVHVKSKAVTVEMNCRLNTPMKYAFAERGSQATPCRNVPIVCGLCPSTLTAGKESRAQPAQWRYNMEEHLAHAHPEYASPRNPDGDKRLPHAVWISMKTTDEEKALGIPLGKIPAPFSRVAGPDEGVEEPQLGVRRIPVRMAPVGQTRPAPGGTSGRARKKQKTGSGAAVASSSGKK